MPELIPTMGGRFGMGASGGASDLGEDGVGWRADNQSRMTSSLAAISRDLAVMVEMFWVRWDSASSRQSMVVS